MNYVVFDLEATCEEGKRDFPNETIEIGAQLYNEKLELVSEFNEFIRPILNPELTDFCKKLTSITQEQVDGADTFPDVYSRFQKWAGRSYILCSWGHYDKHQLQRDCQLHKLSDVWCSRHISLKHQFMKNHGQGKRKAGMFHALKYFGLELDGTHHRGIDDARNIGKIFVRDFENWKFKV